MLINITKKLVIVFIIGILVGAIITTAGFLIFSKTCGAKNNNMTPPGFSQSDNSNNSALPGFSDGNSGNFNGKGQPPQMPNENGNSRNSQLPEAPGENNSNSSTQLPNTNSF